MRAFALTLALSFALAVFGFGLEKPALADEDAPLVAARQLQRDLRLPRSI